MEKFARVNHAHARVLDDLPNLLQPAVPAGGADHQIHTQRRHAANVLHHGVGSGEVNAHVDALEFLAA